jgi:hypothetical protein
MQLRPQLHPRKPSPPQVQAVVVVVVVAAAARSVRQSSLHLRFLRQ